MKFNKNLDWLKESDNENDLLADDELDAVEEEMNEGLYVDPSNYDKHNDLVDVVDKAGNPQKMTQATYDKNKDSGEFEKKEPEKKEVKAGQKVDARDLKEGSSYVTKEDMYYGDVEEFDGIYDIDELKKKGFVKDNEVVIPAGTKLNYEGFNGGAYTFDINGEEFDLSLDDIDLYSAEETEEKEPKEKEEPKAAMSGFEKSPEFTELKDAIGNVSEPDSSSDAAWNRDRAYIYSQAFPIFAKMEKQGRDPLEEFKQYKDNLPVKQEDIDKIKKELRELDSDLTSKRYLYGYKSDEVKELDNKREQIVNKLNDAEATYKNQIPKNFETALFYYGKLKSGDDKFKRSFIPWMKKHTQAYYNKYKDGATPPNIPAVAGLPEIEFEQSSKDKERQNISNANSLDKIKDLANKGDLEAIKALLNS